MSRPQLEVADVIQQYGDAYLARYGAVASGAQRRVLYDVGKCRTAAFGGHKKRCDHCDYGEIQYNSCGNRHCPKCQGRAQAAWLKARERELIEAPYAHVVFTLPEPLRPVALHNPREIYGLLFQKVAQTLQTIARDPRHLGAEIGFLGVLHTWGQQLYHHPHIHCLVPAGGLALEEIAWRSCPKRFFLPVRVLSRFFRRVFLDALTQRVARGEVRLVGQCQALNEPREWQRWMAKLRKMEWVVYAKEPMAGPQQVLKYLARYTYRVAITNRRLLKLEDGKVTFRWRDYRRGNRQCTMELDAVEFIRRFLLHALPRGLQRVRHYGFLANGVRKAKLALCRQLLGAFAGSRLEDTGPPEKAETESTPSPESDLCPICRVGRLRVSEISFAQRRDLGISAMRSRPDTS